MAQNYPHYYDRLRGLIGKLNAELPLPMADFAELHAHAIRAGALSPKTKELIALAIAIALRCDGCIAYHAHDALEAGASREEIAEAIGVAILMGAARRWSTEARRSRRSSSSPGAAFSTSLTGDETRRATSW